MHYESSGYDPAKAIAPGLQARVKDLQPGGDDASVWHGGWRISTEFEQFWRREQQQRLEQRWIVGGLRWWRVVRLSGIRDQGSGIRDQGSETGDRRSEIAICHF